MKKITIKNIFEIITPELQETLPADLAAEVEVLDQLTNHGREKLPDDMADDAAGIIDRLNEFFQGEKKKGKTPDIQPGPREEKPEKGKPKTKVKKKPARPIRMRTGQRAPGPKKPGGGGTPRTTERKPGDADVVSLIAPAVELAKKFIKLNGRIVTDKNIAGLIGEIRKVVLTRKPSGEQGAALKIMLKKLHTVQTEMKDSQAHLTIKNIELVRKVADSQELDPGVQVLLDFLKLQGTRKNIDIEKWISRAQIYLDHAKNSEYIEQVQEALKAAYSRERGQVLIALADNLAGIGDIAEDGIKSFLNAISWHGVAKLLDKAAAKPKTLSGPAPLVNISGKPVYQRHGFSVYVVPDKKHFVCAIYQGENLVMYHKGKFGSLGNAMGAAADALDAHHAGEQISGPWKWLKKGANKIAGKIKQKTKQWAEDRLMRKLQDKEDARMENDAIIRDAGGKTLYELAEEEKREKRSKMQSLNEITPADTFNLPGDMGKFLGGLARNKIAITIEGDQGAGKSTFFIQLANAFAEAGLGVGIVLTELASSAPVITENVSKFVTAENRSKISITDKLNKIGDISALAGDFDVLLIDSWTRIADAKPDDFARMREKYPKCITAAIFQRTTGGEIRGGNQPIFDADINIELTKADNTFVNNYAECTKNRFGPTGVHWNIARGTLMKEAPVSGPPKKAAKKKK